jgi:subtilase family serine protease
VLVALVLATLVLATFGGTAFGDDGSAPAGAGTAPVPTGPGYHEHHGGYGESDVNICSYATAPGEAHCNARVRTDAFARQLGATLRARGASPATLPDGTGYLPADLQAAYGTSASAGNGTGLTVAIVDAYDDPNAESDLTAYRQANGLAPCTTANGCFKKVNQNGVVGSYPQANRGWAEEISLDLDMVSAVCQHCNILLVEAASNSFANLGTAVNRAATMGAVAISNSYGGNEFSTETSADNSYFNHPGVAITASSGDSGYGVEYPAASPKVVAVGGTSLARSGSAFTETAWNGAGSGCSAYEAKPAWQSDPSCAKRAVADVSAVADPSTGVWVYDTYGDPGWEVFGGTSVASPIIASVYALAYAGPGTGQPASYPYAAPGSLHDVVGGSNGSCSVFYLCNGIAGYDGPTGLGTPNTTAAFSASAPPLPTPDFSVGANPSSVGLSAGTSNPSASTIAVTSLNGMTGAVTLSAQVTAGPAGGLTASPPPSVTLSSGSTASAQLGLTAQTAGSYTVTITATAGTIVHTTTVGVTVNPSPDFTISASPSSRSVKRGSSTTYAVTITRTGGFAGTVTLTVSGQKLILTPTFSPAQTSGSTSTLTVVTSRADSAGTRTLTITGSAGTLKHATAVTLRLT